MTVELEKLIALAPDILKFLIPGYICLRVFAKVACFKIGALEQWILSVVISFCTVALVETIISALGRVFAVWELVLWCIGLDFLFGVAGALIWKSSLLEKVMKQKLGSTLFDGALQNAIDWKEASVTCVYLKSESSYYVGYVVMVDETNDGWITISAPIHYDASHNILSTNEGEHKTIMAIPLADVKCIKIIN